MGEMAITSASDDTLFTCAVAPHQVYGPRDNLFLPNILEAGGTGRLRIFGNGQNRICFTHIDNYAHGLIIAEQALYKGSPANGKFYIVTDGDTHPHPQGYARLWETIDEACVAMGFTSLWEKMKLPLPLLVVLAYIAEFIGWMIGTTMKLNRFNVKVLTMHRWFIIDAAKKDLKYEPIVPYSVGWPDTLEWFKENWLPTFDATAGITGISDGSQKKIDYQAAGTAAGRRQGSDKSN
mmetsp:Transcript_18436/g.51321  ORF Transcript_18436/g.51321 Transcript_18436/m.51321 type:complete len:236 (-) Transcript_18436:695-1402(-)